MNRRNYAVFGMFPRYRALIASLAQREKEIIEVMTVLPGKYRYEQVEAALNASGVHPHDLYMDIAANNHTIALARFYEALYGAKEGEYE